MLLQTLNESLQNLQSVFPAEDIPQCPCTDQAEEEQIERIAAFISCIRGVIPSAGLIAVEYAIGIDIARLAGFHSFIPGIAVWIACHLTGYNRTAA